MTGTVVRIMANKGFGFIHGEDGKDYFLHQTEFNGFFEDLVRDIEGGRKIEVTFDVVHSQKGLRAGNVQRTDGGV